MTEARPSSSGEVVSVTAGSHDPAVQAGIRAGFGIAAIVIEITRQVLAGAAGGQALEPSGSAQPGRVGDVFMGAAWAGARAGGRTVELTGRVVSPVVGLVLDPPLVPRVLRPVTYVDSMARRWRADRPGLARSAAQSSQAATPVAVEAVARTIDVDRVLAVVIDQIDVDALASQLITRMDLTMVVQGALRQIDIDALALDLIDQVQVEPLVAQVVARVDTVDVVGKIMDELPTDQLVAAIVDHLDVAAVVSAALDQVDLTSLVVDRVDLGTVVNAALDKLDLTSIVMDRVDLPLVATTVIEQIDLAGTIRDSTGSVATEAIRGVRMSSVDADRAIARLVDRFTLRRRARRLDAPGTAESMQDEPDPAKAGPDA